jgi:hypothetical protein
MPWGLVVLCALLCDVLGCVNVCVLCTACVQHLQCCVGAKNNLLAYVSTLGASRVQQQQRQPWQQQLLCACIVCCDLYMSGHKAAAASTGCCDSNRWLAR